MANLNGCQMVINALVSSKLRWEKNTDKIFGGLILFLTLENAPPKEEGSSIPQYDVPHPPQSQGESPTMLEGLQGFVDEITSHTWTIATRLLKVATLVENAPSAILEDD
nr:uncharacterized protein LOC109155335 [Ipomoea batatas]